MGNPLHKIVIALLPILVAQALIGTTAGQLLVDDVTEGKCWSLRKLLPKLYHGVNVFAILPPGDYYVPMASEALYRAYAEGLLGRPANNSEELHDMQLILGCGPVFTAIVNKGYPHMEKPPTFIQACAPVGLPSLGNLGLLKGKVNLDYVQALCIGGPAIRPNGTTNIPASPLFTETVDSIVWVNSDETAFLIYRCPGNGLQDFKVVSKTKTLNATDIEIIKEKILPFGFKEEHFSYMTYD